MSKELFKLGKTDSLSATDVQLSLFNQIKDKLAPEQRLVDVVSELLHVSGDSAYRRIRGEKPLLMDELCLLCQHFHLSVDELLKSRSVGYLFELVQLQGSDDGFYRYLFQMHQQVQALHQQQGRLFYLSKDIPFFHFLLFPALFHFKYYFWMKTIAEHPDFRHKVFINEAPDTKVVALAAEMKQLFLQIQSVEIWNTESLNGTIRQLEFCRQAGYIQDPLVWNNIVLALDALIDHLELQAELGLKFLPGTKPGSQPGSMQMFCNRIALADNLMVAESSSMRTAYVNHSVVDFMFTSSPAFTDYAFQQIQRVIRKSTQVSMVGDRDRNIFFQGLRQTIRHIRK